ncbi:DUF2141 domain-containing protein [Hyphomicrobiales bacterium FT118]|uniref:DUF2141 domain-containing protein n=1 Tax=Futiania mangrovi TaxID=2959716 RepID=A0A9J6P7Z7_9PROT|nr:DUF2141 domain-containing protein [Futiania mangrovii]MCP1335524.1 DUF2141 domain-containing protein [Futiania mangrovii]
MRPGRSAGTRRARQGSQGFGFFRLPPGEYAVIVFHDENDNGLLDTGIFGVPVEGYGFSNNAEGFLSAPAWRAARVVLGNADHKRIAISLIY